MAHHGGGAKQPRGKILVLTFRWTFGLQKRALNSIGAYAKQGGWTLSQSGRHMGEPRMRHHWQISGDQWRDQTFAQRFFYGGFVAGLSRVNWMRVA